jgi:two-component system, LuxR family, sensor kinase FixL
MTQHLAIAVAEKFPWSRKQLEAALAPLDRTVSWLRCTPATGTDLLAGRVDIALLDPATMPELWNELRLTTAQPFSLHQIIAVVPRGSKPAAAALFSAGAGEVLYEDELELLPRAIERFFAERARLQPWIATAREREFRDKFWCQGLEAAGVSLWIWNCREGFLEYSHNMAPIYGLSPAEYPESSQKLIDKIGQVLDPDDVQIITKLFFPAPEAADAFELEYRYRHPAGDMRWLWLKGILDRDEQGTPIRVIGVVTDINERKQTALLLRDSETRFRDFMDKGPCVVFIKDAAGRYAYVNQLFIDAIIADHARDSIIGKHDSEIYPPEIAAKILQRDQEIWQTGQTWQGIEHVPVADGTVLSWWVVKFLYSNSRGEQFLGGVALDLTDRLKAEDRAQTLLEELAHQDRLGTIGQLVSELAHELNQPLYAVANFAEASLKVLSRPDGSKTQILPWLEQIQAQSKRMSEIIRRVSGYGSKAMPLPQAVKLNELIRSCCELLTPRLRKEPVEMEFDLAGDLPLVTVQPTQIQQIIVNLVTNALEALQGEPATQRRITIRTRRDPPDHVLIEVSDNGPGISPELLPSIFVPFTTTKSEGMGLGLSIVRSIVESHGGQILAKPRQPRGMIFQIRLPIEAPVPYELQLLANYSR